MVDDEGVSRRSDRFDLEAELLLDGGVEGWRGVSIFGGGRSGPGAELEELGLVGSPVEREVVAAGEAGMVDDGFVESGALQAIAEVFDGFVRNRELTEFPI